MKMKTIVLLFIVIITISICGCIEEQSNVTDFHLHYKSIDSINVTETKFSNDNTIIEGKVVNVLFGKNKNDVLIFEDGIIIACYDAETFIWKIGEMHRIEIEYDWLDNTRKLIRKVEILE